MGLATKTIPLNPELGFLMNTVKIGLLYRKDKTSFRNNGVFNCTQCPQKINPCSVIFFSFSAMNKANYSSLPQTSNLTPPELMRNPG